MLKKITVAALAAGCCVQTADAFAAGGMAPLARATPGLRAASAARPRRASLCTVNMGEKSVAFPERRGVCRPAAAACARRRHAAAHACSGLPVRSPLSPTARARHWRGRGRHARRARGRVSALLRLHERRSGSGSSGGDGVRWQQGTRIRCAHLRRQRAAAIAMAACACSRGTAVPRVASRLTQVRARRHRRSLRAPGQGQRQRNAQQGRGP